MRLFTGIALPQDVSDKLSDVVNRLRPTARINWSPVENLHITSKFVGAWPEDRLTELEEVLATISSAEPLSITVSQYGFFPNPQRPHSFFAGVQAGPELAKLAHAIDLKLAGLGCPVESRAYRPHVTLARVKATHDIRDLRAHIAATNDFEFGSFHAESFHLYLSSPGVRGSVYTKLATYDLMREKNKTS